MAETWKKIPGYPDYEVSDLGKIRSYKGVNQNAPRRKRPRLMKQRIADDGYPRVTLQNKDGKKVVRQVHLLVARAFLGPANGRLVLHKDGRPHNRKLSNLQYGSHQRNMDDKYAHGTHGMGEFNTQALLTERDRNEIVKLKGEMTQQEIADIYGVSRQTVSDIHRGVTWNHVHPHLKKMRATSIRAEMKSRKAS
jgi:DNA-binding XRE family transcriptional regulator